MKSVKKKGIITAVIMLAAIIAGVCYAKYSYSGGHAEVAHAEEFYFSSDLLNGKLHTLPEGTTEVEFTLNNKGDDLRFSEVDVNYTVEVKDITKTESGTGSVNCSATLSKKSDTLEKNTESETSETITLSNLEGGHTYEVTATGTNGYEITLTGEFYVQPEAVYKSLEDCGDYVLLTVWSQGYEGDVTVYYPDGMIPDNTDARMREAQTNSASFTDSESFSEAEYQSHTYRFFYGSGDLDSFKVTYGEEGSIEAEDKQPQ